MKVSKVLKMDIGNDEKDASAIKYNLLLFFKIFCVPTMPKVVRSYFNKACWERFRDKDDLWSYMHDVLVSDFMRLTF